jgi:hypothetical protein
LLHDVCDSLRISGANVAAAESAMMEEQRVYHVELIVDVSKEENIKSMEWMLITRLLRDVVFLPDGSPRFKIHKLYNLWLAKEAYTSQRMLQDSVAVRAELRVPPRVYELNEDGRRNRVKAFRLKLPSSMKEVLRTHVYDHTRNLTGYYLRLSDTKDRFMRILFFKANDPVLHARLEYKDRLGAAADVTGAISQRGFNILAGYLGPAEESARARCELIVRCDGLPENSSIKEAFEQSLEGSAALRDLSINVGYPRGYSEKWEPKRLSAVDELENGIEHGSRYAIKPLKASLDSHCEALSREVPIPNNSNDSEIHRWALALRLQQQYHEIWPISGESSTGKALFISCPHSGRYLQIAKERAKSKKFLVFTGEHLEADPNIRLGILNRINSCTHFLGIWSKEDVQATAGNVFGLSPWLLWEFGIAESFRLAWRLLVAAGIDKQIVLRIAPDVGNVIFDLDFESKLDYVLDVLAELPIQRKRS